MGVVLITGANRGIGLALSRSYRERGEQVIAACRRSSPELDALGVRVEQGVDVTDQAAVDGLVARLGGQRLDVLVNNAGILTRESLAELDFDRIRRQLEVNALGLLRVTAALLPHLGQGSKVAMITSRMGSIADNTSGSRYGYRMSKAALNIAAVSLAHDLRERGIAVTILHPGYVRTDMTERTGDIAPEAAAGGLIARIDELTLGSSGGFWHSNGSSLPW